MITAIGLALSIVILIGIHLAILLPGVTEIYIRGKESVSKDPIDRVTVNEAIKLLED